jgi:hypothetical protein
MTAQSLLIESVAVVAEMMGLSDLNAQRSRHHNHHVTPIAFDLIRRSTHIIAQSHR